MDINSTTGGSAHVRNHRRPRPGRPAVRTAVTVVMLLVLGAGGARAQAPRPSQPGAVEQTVGATRIRIDYSRPSARGRTLFGGIVPWGRPWNPGADSATRIGFGTAVRVNGKAIPAGEYSIWAVPDSQAWTMILSGAAHVYHVPYPEGRDVLRIRVAPRSGDYLETLTFYFPIVDGKTAVLYLHWGGVIVPLTIEAP